LNENPAKRTLAKLMLKSFWGKLEEAKPYSPISSLLGSLSCHALLRLYWLGLSVLNPEEVIYMDTDSIIYKRRPGVPKLPTGLYLGQFKDELDGNDVILEFAATGPINYGSVRLA